MSTLYQPVSDAVAQIVTTIGLLACCVAFSCLGLWQINRSHEKQVIEDRLDASLTAAPIELQADAQPFSRVRVSGRFDPETLFFIDNRVFQGRPGFEVIQAFDTHGGARLLVDRGWTETTEAHELLAPTGAIEIIGLLLPDFGAGLTFGQTPEESWPMRLQTLDLETMSRVAETNFSDLLKLRAHEPGALQVQAFELPMSSSRHMGYAVQWFGLAFAAVVIWSLLARQHWKQRA